MQVFIRNTAALIAQIAVAKRLLPTKLSQVWANSIKFTLGPKGVQLAATSLDVHMLVNVDAGYEGTGAFAFEFHELEQVLKKAKSADRLTITVTGDKVQFTAGRLTFDTPNTLECMPEFDLPTGLSWFIMPHEFGGYLDRAMQVASRDTTREHLCGVNMRHTPEGLRMEATDGHRLYWVTMPEESIGGAAFVRDEAASLVAGLAGRKEYSRELIDLGLNDERDVLALRIGPYTFWGRVPAMSYPDIDQVLPDRKKCRELLVNPAELREAVETVSIFANKRTKSVNIAVQPCELEVSAANEQGKSGKMPVSAEHDGQPGKFKLNFSYLLEALDIWPKTTKELTIAVTQNERDLVVSPVQFEVAGSHERVIVMPLRD